MGQWGEIAGERLPLYVYPSTFTTLRLPSCVYPPAGPIIASRGDFRGGVGACPIQRIQQDTCRRQGGL